LEVPVIEFAGIKFRNPFVVASSPLTAKPFLLKNAWDNGAAAASTKLTLIKQPFYKKCRMYHDPKLGSIVCVDRRLDLEEGVKLIEETKKLVPELVLFSNITHEGADLESWGYLARAMEEAGADLIEPNFICPNLSLTATRLGQKQGQGGALTGQDPDLARTVVSIIKKAVKVPVVPKLTPNVTDITAIAAACVEGGADGLTLAGAQMSLPPVDLYNLDHVFDLAGGASFGSLGGQACLLPGLAMVAQTASKVNVPIVGGGGLFTWEHAAQYMLWGSTLVTACTSLMWYGYELIPQILGGLDKYMGEMSFATYGDLVGKALHNVRAASDLEMIPQVPVLDENICDNCGACARPAHCYALELVDGMPVIDPDSCMGCSACVAVCPTGALYFPTYADKPIKR
jgi:dihydroorotate dehydrogenase/NAD-dependent dihydropyrimidine dehydrogenase PreA subunit